MPNPAKHRKYYSLILVCLIIAAVSYTVGYYRNPKAPAPAAASPRWHTVTSQAHHFQVQFPCTDKLFDNVPGDTIFFQSCLYPDIDAAQVKVSALNHEATFAVSSRPAKLPAGTSASPANLRQLISTAPQGRLKLTDSHLAGQSALLELRTSSQTIDSGPAQTSTITNYWMLHDGQVYLISYEKGDHYTGPELSEQFLKSFAFIN